MKSAALALLLICAAGCASGPSGSSESAPTTGPGTLSETDYPGLLRPPATLGREVVWRQRVTAAWGEGSERGFDAALQKQGDTLTMIGLSPLGAAGFVVLLKGEEIEFRNETGEPMPFPPRFIVLDVQRTFFPWVFGPEGAPQDGEHDGRIGEEQVREVWKAGRLVERRFTRGDGQPDGTIAIRYEWDNADWWAPTRAILDNGWFGYRLTVDTLEETRLPPAD